MRSRGRSLLLCVVPVLAATVAGANSVTYSASTPTFSIGTSASASLPRFDPILGVLRQVEITVSANVSGAWNLENTNASATSVGGYSSGQYVGAIVPVAVPAGGFPFAPNPAFLPDATALAAYDGTTDYAGASGIVLDFSHAYGDGAPVQTTALYTDDVLPAYVGSGSFSVVLGNAIVQGPYVPPGVATTYTLSIDATVSVRYVFDDVPTAICRAAPFSGCPCGNASTLAHGCANSIGGGGGDLVVSGVASLAADTLVLHGSGMTNSSVLYFQGTSFSYAQTPYGDGLRCVGGALRRLKTKTNVAGASQFPASGDPSISTQGAIGAPGTRYYQAVYRDNGVFCTASHFNVTSGVAVSWGP